jgi:hypothetical protein
MKKRKAKLREKIKNRPKTRNHSKKRKKAPAEQLMVDNANPSPPQNVDEGMQVMSQVILDFAKPLLETCDDEEAERKALSLAIFIWNTTLLPDDEQDQVLDSYLAQYRGAIPPEQFDSLSDYVARLVESKKTRFAHDHRKVTNCTFGDYGENHHIEVGYTMES